MRIRRSTASQSAPQLDSEPQWREPAPPHTHTSSRTPPRKLPFRLIAAAYERRSLAIGSHRPFEQWGPIPTRAHHRAVSLLDRLLHHCQVVVTDGESYCMRQN
ncbi:MAG: ATP-binding protein [Pseudonocardiales bacterium]